MKKVKWYILVNSTSGKGHNRELWRKVRLELSRLGIEHEGYYSRKITSFQKQLHKQIDAGTRHFIAVGGDGSIHHLIEGLYKHPSVPLSEFTVACIPVGSGNDWSRTYHFPHTIRACAQLIVNGHTDMQDLAVLRYKNQEHIVVNNCGMGYDALVLRESLMMNRNSLGKMKYVYCVFRLLFSHQSSLYKIEMDGNAFETDVFSITMGNCAYNGGGLKQLAHAIPNDGKLDITLIRSISPWTIIKNLHHLFTGTLDHVKHVSSLHAEHIRIHADEGTYIEADGELIGTGTMELQILPQAIRFVLPLA